MSAAIVPHLGMVAPKCKCVTHCEKGVDPMNTCICKIPGEVITAYCDQCDPKHERFTWHANGSCMNCVNRVREERKKQMADRHARIMASPANPDTRIEEIEDADYRDAGPALTGAPTRLVDLQGEPLRVPTANESQKAPVQVSIIMRIGNTDIVLTDRPHQVEEILRSIVNK